MKAINPATHKPNGVFIPTTSNSQLAFSTLALGSALALMVYPHAVTGVLSTKRRDIIKRNWRCCRSTPSCSASSPCSAT